MTDNHVPDLDETQRLARIAQGIRRRATEVAIAKNGAYLGQACSAAEILAALLGRVLDDAADDVLVISPAHYTLPLWCAMAETGSLDPSLLEDYGEDGARLEMIGGAGSPGMPFTTGSLAQGLSQACGLALGRSLKGAGGHVYVLVSDGELQEGQTWEALLWLGHHAPAGLTVILDLNDSQVDGPVSQVIGIEPVAEKLAAFGLDVIEIEGNEIATVVEALERPRGQQTRVVAARTRIWAGIPSLATRSNLHFVRFRPGEAEAALRDVETGAVPA